MNLLSPVSTIMSAKVITVSPDDTLLKINAIFKQYRIHHIPVVDDGRLVGMVSNSDLLFFQRGFKNGQDKFDNYRLKTHQATQIMTRKIAKLEVSDRINVALEIFKENLFHAIPVVDSDKLVGIVTTYDIISHLAKDKAATNTYPTI